MMKMRKLLLILTAGLFLSANLANACDEHKAKASKASNDKACCAKMATTAKKEATGTDKKECTDKASMTKGNHDCCKSGTKTTEKTSNKKTVEKES
jgi:hypothetical protein